MDFILITNDPEWARHAERCGVRRIMVDLEILGKEQRQANRNTLISRHSFDDITRIRAVLHSSELMVRINPLHDGSPSEIQAVLARGAAIIMLPMFRCADEVRRFTELVGGRARCCLLLETQQALARLDYILEVDGVHEIFVGLNDLHVGLGVDFMFEVLTGGLVEYIGNRVTRRGLGFGFGGVARLGCGLVDARLILSEHFRLGSGLTILSRDFHSIGTAEEFSREIAKVNQYCKSINKLTSEQMSENSRLLRLAVAEVARARSRDRALTLANNDAKTSRP